MTETVDNFFEKMCSFFQNKENEYDAICFEMQRDYSERLDTVIIEDIFMPDLIDLLEKNNDTELLKKILETAKMYMGPKTTVLQYEADRALGRVVKPPSFY